MRISDMATELINKGQLNVIKALEKDLSQDIVIKLLTRVSLGHKATKEEITYIHKWYEKFIGGINE
jgi:hypothetical protein